MAIPLAFVQLVQIGTEATNWGNEQLFGPSPLELPLRDLHSGMLVELEFNLDCLKSFDRLRHSDEKLELCKLKTRYIESWFSNVAVHTSRDFYSSSEATHSDWKKLKNYYSQIQKVSNNTEFVELERKSEITLRDALFMTGYIRYFYNNYFSVSLPKECGFADKTPECLKHEERLFGEFPAWKEQIESWDHMPSRYIVDDGKKVDFYTDWLSLVD